MDVRILGPVELWRVDGSVYLARRQHRLILGILALEANRVVTTDRLVDLIWTDSPPRRARAVIHSRISELRAALAGLETTPDELRSHGDGYVLRIQPDQVDAHRFRRLLTQARAARSDRQVRATLRRALGLWRGPMLGGWLPHESHAAICHALEATRLTAAEDLYEVELRLGNQVAVVDEMLGVSVAHPGRERLTGQVMRALHRTGRTAEATQVYDRCRRWLAEELGLDPGGELQALNLAILRGEPDSTVEHGPRTATAPGTPSTKQAMPGEATESTTDEEFTAVAPRALPADVTDFTGRSREVAVLCELLGKQRDSVAIGAVSGAAGVGKTALCLHVAHRLRDQFPDGQLFANLHGVDAEQPAAPFDVLGRFLRALGVDGLALPSTLDDRVDLYRGLLARRRVLVVLDNAGAADQVVPLIPGGGGCGVLINGRVRVAPEIGAEALHLHVLDPQQAGELLARIAGPPRVAAEPEAATELARLCGYLPLAIRVAAAKLAIKPHWTVHRLAGRLVDERRRLDRLTHGHLNVRSSIALSYGGLDEDGRSLLRRLGDIDLPEVNIWACAALLESSIADAEETLEQLYDAQLIDIAGRDSTGHARYRLHDLVRLFARECAETDEPADALEEARIRVFSAWLTFVEAAHRSVHGGGYQNIPSPAPRWPLPMSLTDHALAADPLGWVDAERQSITAMIDRAARYSHSQLCWGLACTVAPLIEMRRDFDAMRTILDTALAAARDDRLGQAAVRYRMGMLAADRQDYGQARAYFDRAADLFTTLDHHHGHATVTAYLGMVERHVGDHATALQRYQNALPVLEACGDLGGTAFALRGIAQVYLTRGEHDQADAYLARALDTARRSRSRPGLAQVQFWQGMLRLDQGRNDEAHSLFTEVLHATKALGERAGEAQALRGLGICYQRQGDPAKARSTLTEALRRARQPRRTILEDQIRRAIAQL